MQKLYTYLLALLCLLSVSGRVMAQKNEDDEKKVDKFATITIAVLNSDRPYHVAFVRYFDKNGDILLNTSEEFKIDISKSPRFATGSVRKTIPVYPNAHYVEVTVNYCTNMHENQFFVSEFEQSNNEATFVFRGVVEDLVMVEFDGIQQDKPCTFQIKGANTSTIFYADYNNAKKRLPEESKNKDVSVEVSETSLYKYKINKVEKDKNGKKIKVTVALVQEEAKEK